MVNPNAGILAELEEQQLAGISIGADDGGSTTLTVVSITGGCPSSGPLCFITLDAACGPGTTG